MRDKVQGGIAPDVYTFNNAPKLQTTSKLTGAKLCVWVSSLGRGFFQLIKSPHVVLQVLVVLRVDGVDLAFSGTRREQRLHKELCKPSHTKPISYRHKFAINVSIFTKTKRGSSDTTMFIHSAKL